MSEIFYLFLGLTPTSTLQLVAEYLDAEAALPELLDDMSVRVVEPPFRDEPQVTVVVEYPYREGKGKEKHAAFEALVAVYGSIPEKVGPLRVTELPFDEEPAPLRLVLPELLKSQKSRQELEKTTRGSDQIDYPLIQDEKILVACNVEDDRSRSIFRRLQIATQVKVAFAEVVVGNAAKQFLLYHVKDDKTRNSDFVSAWGAELFKDCALLDCYWDEGTQYVVGLPPSIVPGREALTYFCRILLKAPALFGGVSPTPDTHILAVVTPPNLPQPDASAHLLHIGGLRFGEEWRIAPRVAKLSRCEILMLENDDAALSTLRERIDEIEPPIRYQLELRCSRYQHWNQAEYDRLQLQRNQIVDRLMELESLHRDRPRPKLYRFTHEQLPILARVLRAYRPDDLVRLRYGFHASRKFLTEGLHFIYVNHDIAMTELDPLVRWGEDERQPMEFWLDPHWAYYYHAENRSLVFVPRGTRLQPTFHSWESDLMDSYLRESLKQVLSRSDGDNSKVSALNDVTRPVYVFDGTTGRNQSLFLTILDLEKFSPITSPACLGWLNDNLCLLDHLGVDKSILLIQGVFPQDGPPTQNLWSVEEFISSIADDVTRSRILRDVSQTVGHAIEEFDKRALEFCQTTGKNTDDLMTAINGELDRTIEKSKEFMAKASELNDQIKELWVPYRKTLAQKKRTEKIINLTRIEEQRLSKRIARLVDSVNAKIIEAKTRQAELENDVNETIAALESTQKRLLREIRELKTLLRRAPEDFKSFKR